MALIDSQNAKRAAGPKHIRMSDEDAILLSQVDVFADAAKPVGDDPGFVLHPAAAAVAGPSGLNFTTFKYETTEGLVNIFVGITANPQAHFNIFPAPRTAGLAQRSKENLEKFHASEQFAKISRQQLICSNSQLLISVKQPVMKRPLFLPLEETPLRASLYLSPQYRCAPSKAVKSTTKTRVAMTLKERRGCQEFSRKEPNHAPLRRASPTCYAPLSAYTCPPLHRIRTHH